MNLKRFLALSIAVLLITTLLAGCAKSGMANTAMKSEVAMDAGDGSSGNELTGSTASTSSVTPQNQKLIRTVYLDAETEDMDTLLASVDERIAELGGYVESRQVDKESINASYGYRRASLTIRIPAENLDTFVNHVSDSSNITSNRETAEDITLKYVATESRITALETEQTRLLELLAKAETMNDLLLIESRLTEVRTELEQVTSLLKVYDNRVNYGTIYLDLQQVEKYTQPEPETFWQKISTGFMDSLEGLGTGLLDLLTFLIISLPYLVVIAGIVILVVVIYKRRKKKQQQDEIPPAA